MGLSTRGRGPYRGEIEDLAPRQWRQSGGEFGIDRRHEQRGQQPLADGPEVANVSEEEVANVSEEEVVCLVARVETRDRMACDQDEFGVKPICDPPMSQSTRHRVAEEIDSLDKDKSLPFTEILDAAMVACMVDLPIIGL
jgi:hypothetical protein